MRRKQVLELLLTVYLFGIEEMKQLETHKDIKEFLEHNSLEYGCCSLLRSIWAEEYARGGPWESLIEDPDWWREYTTNRMYWFNTPAYVGYDKELTLQTMQARADLLQNIINTELE